MRDSDYSLNINNKTISANEEVAAAFEKCFADIPADNTRSLNSSSVDAVAPG